MNDTTSHAYPLRLHGQLTEPLSRWLWLVKWFLLIPHFVVLLFLWTAFAVVTVIAFFAILFTGHYPRALFGFNLGVLRWTWRVSYYGYAALGSDRYPPFTLAEVADYPATLELDYPEQLSRGLVLVKWWLLALPHYLILAALAGTATLADDTTREASSIGLLTLVVVFIGISLLFRQRIPRGLFDLAMGLDRWGLRVTVYAALMTDAYPPFRLDQGGDDVAAPPPDDPLPQAPDETSLGSSQRPGPPAGRIVTLVLGVLLVLPSAGLIGVGGAGLWLNSQRDADGYVSTSVQSISSPTAAVTIEDIHLDIDRSTATWLSSEDLGTIRVRVTPVEEVDTFVGVAPRTVVDRWLAGRAHDEISGINEDSVQYLRRPGAAGVTGPAGQSGWAASTSGTGPQELRWTATDGDWSLVTARADGTPGVDVRAAVAAKLPDLAGIAIAFLIGGLVLLGTAGVLIGWGAGGVGRYLHHTDRLTRSAPGAIDDSPDLEAAR